MNSKNTNAGDFQAIPFEFIDAEGIKQVNCFFVRVRGKQELSLENFCGVNLLKMVALIRGETSNG